MRNPLDRQASSPSMSEGQGGSMRRRRQRAAAAPSFRTESGAGGAAAAASELMSRAEPEALVDRVAEAQLAEMYVQSALLQRKGQAETSWRSAGAVLWIIQSGMIILATVALGCAVTFLRFILIPLALAYFISFLHTPLLAIFVRRPLRAFGRSCCSSCCAYASSPERHNRRGSCAGGVHDCIRLGRVPHALAVVLTFLLSASILSAIVLQARSSVSTFIEHSASNNETMYKISDGLARELAKVGINVERDTLGLPGLLSYLGLGDLLASGGSPPSGGGMANVASGADLRIAAAQKLFGSMVDSATQVVLVLVLAAYLMVDRGDSEAHDFGANAAGPEPGGRARAVFCEIERALHHYISSKLLVSLIAGIAVGVVYDILGMQLAFPIGVAVCLLNFVPTVGPMIAAALPIPVLLLDEELGFTRVVALGAGWAVQLFCLNVLELWLLGEDDGRRLTPIGLLGSLVIWTSLWGPPGAILSAPTLVATQVLLAHGALSASDLLIVSQVSALPAICPAGANALPARMYLHFSRTAV